MTNIFTKILAIVAIVAVSFGLYYRNQNTQLNKKVSDQATNIKSMDYTMVSVKDELGKWHSNSIQQNTTIDGLKQSKDSLSQSIVKLAKDYHIKLNSVVAAASIKTELKADTSVRSSPNIVQKDTTFDLSNEPFIIETIHLSKDSLDRELQVFNKQNLVWYTKRETIDPPKSFFLFRWFQKKHDVTYVDIINDNPFIQTTNQKFQIITK